MVKRTGKKIKSSAGIPIARPAVGKKEIEAVRRVLTSGWLTQGPKVKEFEGDFSSYVGSKYAVATSSCTTALHLALLCAGIGKGDCVITVSHSFIATANSIRHCAAEPVFVDIDLDDYNISAASLERLLKEECRQNRGELFYKGLRVAAIMPVHQMGFVCDLGKILALAHRYKLPVVEDAACATGSEIKVGNNWQRIGRPHADIACFSFHPRKLITCGEGGMITTDNPDYDLKARMLRNHAMSVSDITRHTANKVIFEEYLVTGFNYRMTDIQAAIGIIQLAKIHNLLSERRQIASFYRERLKDISWLKLPEEPIYSRPNWQSYPVRVLENAPLSRNELMQYLLDLGISTRRGIMNIHQEKAYASNIRLRNSELARDTSLLLPIFNGVTNEQLQRVVKAIKNA